MIAYRLSLIAHLRPSPKLVLGQKRVTLESLLMAVSSTTRCNTNRLFTVRFNSTLQIESGRSS